MPPTALETQRRSDEWRAAVAAEAERAPAPPPDAVELLAAAGAPRGRQK